MSVIYAVGALIGAVLLLGDKASRTWGVIAVIAAGVAAAIALGLLSLSLAGYSISLILGVVLAVAGGIALTRVQKKLRVVAATIVCAVGALTAAAALGLT